MIGDGLNLIGAAAWQTAEYAGWHDRETGAADRVGLALALVHSEVSETLEAYRKTGTTDWFRESDDKPEGWGSELADVIIRVCELARITETDLDRAVLQKMNYNMNRADVPNGSDTTKRF